jgi:hypothetical protein
MEKGRYYFSGELEVVGTHAIPGGRTYLKVRPSDAEEWLFLPETWLDADKVLEEPAIGSVVLDLDGDAWQRDMDGWSLALRSRDSSKYDWSWDRLVEEYGVDKVIHEPED